MYDSKVVRRRRAALAICVALSVVMLTAYFGEGSGGVFHTLQRGAQEAFAPLETGAGRAFKPFRDAAGWFGDTLDAKGDNDDLRAENERLRKQLGESAVAADDVRQLRGLVKLEDTDSFPSATNPVAARVIVHSPTVWYESVKIDKGSDDGVEEDQPVIAAGGLAGKVTSVTGGTAEVKLITDGSSAVSAQVLPSGASGVVRPEVGQPNDLLLDFVDRGRRVTEGTTVVTSGFSSERVQSRFPRGIPIGRVSRVDLDEVQLYQRVHLKPFADLRRIDIVQVLTSKGRASENASADVTP
ncbi:MAG: rod shape-determining protein MreC [Thermoleophilaceae bacterium]|nr:rod shape-determining protein MreC [Thermoleophilaceae bacterium]